MNDDQLEGLLNFAHKYGADAAILLSKSSSKPQTADSQRIADLIDKGTKELVKSQNKLNNK